MPRYKNDLDKQIERAREQVRVMEKCGQYATVHHENLERLLSVKEAVKKPPKIEKKDSEESVGDNNGR